MLCNLQSTFMMNSMQNQPNVLFDLPEHLYHCICREWINTSDLVRLDVGVTVSSKFLPLFRKLLQNPTFSTQGFDEGLDENSQKWLIDRNVHVSKLILQDSSPLNYFGALSITFYHLRQLVIDNLSVEDHPNFISIVLQLPSLRDVCLHYCYNFGDNLLNFLKESPSQDSKSITKLDLHGSTTLGENHLIYLLERLPYLQFLGLCNCSNFSQVVVDVLLKRCEYIHTLILSYIESVNDDMLNTLVNKYRQLIYLDVSHCCNISDSSIASISERTSLIGLKVASNKNISDHCIRYILTSFSNLEVLDISELSISKSTYLMVAPSCCFLRQLFLMNCHSFDDVSLIRIAECAGECLEQIDLTYCYRITDAGIIGLSKCCRHLRYINFSFCLLITNFGIESMAKSCGELSSLVLAGMNQLTDGCLIVVAEYLPLLEELNISACTLLTDSSVIGLILACRCLKKLDISDNHLIGTFFVERLMQFPWCRKMRYLNLSYCVNIDDKIVQQLRQNYPKLSVYHSRPTNHF